MELEIFVSSQPLGKKIAIMLQESASKVGIKIKITEKDFKLIRSENLKTRKYHLVPAVLSPVSYTHLDVYKRQSPPAINIVCLFDLDIIL